MEKQQGYRKAMLRVLVEEFLSSQNEEKYSEDKKMFSQGRFLSYKERKKYFAGLEVVLRNSSGL